MDKKLKNLILYLVAAAVMVACIGCSSQPLRMLTADDGIVVSIAKQEVTLVKGGSVVRRYRCSTAKAGVGSLVDSQKTPLEWHRVGEKIGDGLPAGAVFRDREWTGEIWKLRQAADEELILSRILRLEGLEKSKNRGGDVDTWDRYIYIHGTNRVDELGKPASSGCIRMDPAQVIELYNAVEEGGLVLIRED